jgi:hypothetical protein
LQRRCTVPDLYLSPSFYGIEDVEITSAAGSFPARVYFPTDVDYLEPAVIRPGKYDLVVFAHGARGPGTSGEGLCPEDWSNDYQLWEEVLHLLACCGFVVVALELSSISVGLEQSVERIGATVAWMRRNWSQASSLWQEDLLVATMREAPNDPGATVPNPPEGVELAIAPAEGSTAARSIVWGRKLIDGGRPVLNPTATAFVGHSWGARACAVAMKRGIVSARAFASIAGTFDDNESPAAVASVGVPSLLIAGDEDDETFSYLRGLWKSTPAPKHQAVMQGLGHWDWFGPYGIHPCDQDAVRPKCIAGWMAASELILGLLTKYLRNRPLPPHLMGPTGSRPPLLQWFDTRKRCAMVVRWEDPSGGGDSSHCVVGQQVFGVWEGSGPSW